MCRSWNALVVSVLAFLTVSGVSRADSIFNESFDGTAGTSISGLGWTDSNGDVTISGTSIDMGNCAYRSLPWRSADPPSEPAIVENTRSITAITVQAGTTYVLTATMNAYKNAKQRITLVAGSHTYTCELDVWGWTIAALVDGTSINRFITSDLHGVTCDFKIEATTVAVSFYYKLHTDTAWSLISSSTVAPSQLTGIMMRSERSDPSNPFYSEFKWDSIHLCMYEYSRPINFNEPFDGTVGSSISGLGWTDSNGDVTIRGTSIDIGNCASRSLPWRSANPPSEPAIVENTRSITAITVQAGTTYVLTTTMNASHNAKQQITLVAGSHTYTCELDVWGWTIAALVDGTSINRFLTSDLHGVTCDFKIDVTTVAVNFYYKLYTDTAWSLISSSSVAPSQLTGIVMRSERSDPSNTFCSEFKWDSIRLCAYEYSRPASFTYDFENLSEGTIVGQDGWSAVPGSNGLFVYAPASGADTTKGICGDPNGYLQGDNVNVRSIPSRYFTSMDTAVEERFWLNVLSSGFYASVYAGFTCPKVDPHYMQFGFDGASGNRVYFCDAVGNQHYSTTALFRDHVYEMKLLMNFSTAGGLATIYYRDVTNSELTFTQDSTVVNVPMHLTTDSQGRYEFNGISVGLVQATSATFADNFCLRSVSDVSGTLSHGRQLILDYGLQLATLVGVFPPAFSDFSLWDSGHFTTLEFVNLGAQELDTLAAQPNGTKRPWCRMYNTAMPGTDFLVPFEESESVGKFVSFLYQDECRDAMTPARQLDMAQKYAKWNNLYPQALVFANFGYWDHDPPYTAEELYTYMQNTHPDMLHFDYYPDFSFPNTAREAWYNTMQRYRTAALRGYDGSGNQPIAYGQYQNMARRSYDVAIPSESYIRLQQFASWAFGFTRLSTYVYNAITGGDKSVLFDSDGDSSPNSLFYLVAEANRQSRNLGPALVRLLSTDVRFIPGKHSVSETLVSQNLGSSAYSASRSVSGYLPPKAFDGTTGSNSNYWSAGTTSPRTPQWIEVNLGQIRILDRIKLYIRQTTSGRTVHQVYVSNSPIQNNRSEATLVYTFDGTTSNGNLLQATFRAAGQYVQVYTTTMPTTMPVAWREIQLYIDNADNTIPAEIKVWSDPNRPVTALTSISNITNLGSLNSALSGDAIVGYFKPLHESFDGPSYSNQEYFMVVNGLIDAGGSALQTQQRIQLNFTSPTQVQLQRLRRSDGVMETLNTTANGSNSWYYQFDLDGGTGDLFKINTGAPFVGTPGQLCLMPGDANEDGKVDVSDLGILAANYGTRSGATWSIGDFNTDGKVDVSDLGILAANYGAGGTGGADFNADAQAFGLAVEGDQPTVTEDVPVTTALGCGSEGLPLVAGMILAGLMLGGLKMKV